MTIRIGIHFLQLFLLVLLPNMVSSQIIFQDTKEEKSQAETIRMFQMALPIWDTIEQRYGDNYRLDILYAGDDIIMLCDGFFDTFLWQNSGWKRLNKARKGGYNYGGKHFVWNNRIFSFGGYGYWQHHGDLIEFDPSSGIWKKLNVSEALPLGPAMINGDILKIISDTCFEVHMKTLHIKKYPIESISKPEKSLVAREIKTGSGLWDFLTMGKYNYLYHKVDDKLYYSDVRTTEIVDKTFFYDTSLIQFRNDSLLKWSHDGKLLSVIDIRDLIKFYQLIDIQPKKSGLPYILGCFSFLFLMGGLLMFWWKHKKKHNLKNNSWQNPMILEVLPFAGTTMNTDQIDNILALDGVIIMEYRKFKRSKLISQINEEFKLKSGKELIVRIKDPEDGRKFLYKIKV